ncbi:hypothetical protein BS50DRAFT_681988 [Corynespora cassiicola Philippines]|uniref:Uncharacterized protein n=1 Tax=Corynespora cassiicola Philippines TaxID=1448308 RepID=A0A2T2N356_CORCC|nr:hypothetical protein BS50DRAFT_681988 [Corynespora cassiicola Philippines]
MKASFFGILIAFGLYVNAVSIPTVDSAQPDAAAIAFGKAEVEKRAEGGVYICTEQYWQGECGYKKQPLGVCIHLDAPWKYTISSFGPDGGIVCSWYSDYDCKNWLEGNIRYPGIADMDTPVPGVPGCKRQSEEGVGLEPRCFGNKLGSFLCTAG